MHTGKRTTVVPLQQGRAKTIGRPDHARRVSPVVAQARAVVAELWSAAVQRHTSNVRVGAQLWVSEKTVRAWGDPLDPKSVDVADAFALNLEGSKALAVDFLESVLARMRAERTRATLDAEQHVRNLVGALGAVIVSRHESGGAAYRRALCALKRRLDEAIEDADAEGD